MTNPRANLQRGFQGFLNLFALRNFLLRKTKQLALVALQNLELLE